MTSAPFTALPVAFGSAERLSQGLVSLVAHLPGRRSLVRAGVALFPMPFSLALRRSPRRVPAQVRSCGVSPPDILTINP